MEGDALVIGAGQAGLAVSRHLRRLGATVTTVDAAERVGDVWRQRYDSLTLFTPRRFSALPGLVLPGKPAGYATAGEFADYLEQFAAKFELPVMLGDGVVALTSVDGGFAAELTSGRILIARAVILATGGFQLPVVPDIAARFDVTVQQLTAATYRRPGDIQGASVLVVGDGATGRDIAAELAGSHRATLATGKSRRLMPERVLGLSTWTWLKRLGLLAASAKSSVGRMMQRADPFPDRQRSLDALRHLGVSIAPRLISAAGRKAAFADGRAAEFDCVVWCVGYRDDSAWVRVADAVDASGRLLHTNGRSPVDGLYLVGRPWQRNRASALIMGADADAEVVALNVAERLGYAIRTAGAVTAQSG